MSSAYVSASQAVEESDFISSLMKSGDVFIDLQTSTEQSKNMYSAASNKPQTMDFDESVKRESLFFESADYTVPIFHPVDHTSKLNLLIEVTKNQALQGVVICDLEFICDNIPVIKNKYKPSNQNTYKLEEKEGKSVYKLECDVEPRLVCKFIEAIYDGKIEVNQDNQSWCAGRRMRRSAQNFAPKCACARAFRKNSAQKGRKSRKNLTKPPNNLEISLTLISSDFSPGFRA